MYAFYLGLNTGPLISEIIQINVIYDLLTTLVWQLSDDNAISNNVQHCKCLHFIYNFNKCKDYEAYIQASCQIHGVM